jgi:hypothetical protein
MAGLLQLFAVYCVGTEQMGLFLVNNLDVDDSDQLIYVFVELVLSYFLSFLTNFHHLKLALFD